MVKYITVSPSSLNTYLKCGYKYKLDRLFSIPKVKEIPLAFGTAVHKGLEDYYRSYANTGKYPESQLAVNSFQDELSRQLLSKQDHDELAKRGVDILKDYLEETKDERLEVVGTEYNFGSRNVYLNKIKLTGKVDRIDYVDKERKEVRVVDYKTGKPKSLNQILGKTANSDESYKRQLVFYKLLSQLDKSFNKKNVVSTRLEFVEKGYNGKYKPVEYEVTNEDLKDLRNIIKETAENIRNLEFNKTEDMKNCERCQYKDHCLR